MARLKDFERELRVATAGLDPAAIAALLARTAEEALAEAIGSGQASPAYTRYVNGRADIAEEQVKPPGPILYVFEYGAEIARFALDWARAASPVHSGAYRNSWFAMVGGVQVNPDAPSAIPPGAAITITNDQPYARKIEVGHMVMSVPPRIVERLKTAVMGRYGNFVSARTSQIRLEGGYILKGRFTRGIGKFARKGLRKDTAAGAEMTYPALQIAPR
jgi:hypothetical protein